MKATVADTLRGKLEGRDIIVEFGQSQPPTADEKGRTISLSQQIVMPPSTAKRLISVLGDCLRKHATVRAAEVGAPAPTETAELMRRGQIPVNAPPDEAGDKAALLLRLVSSLGVPYQYERSFRMCEGALLANRFLLTVNTCDIPRPVEQVADICHRLGMPRRLEVSAEQSFSMAKCLHFGFESGTDSIIFKLYLERAIAPAEVERSRTRSEPILQHLAFKWDILREADVVTRYLCHPILSVEGIEGRLAQVYRDGPAELSLEIAKAVLRLAASRTPAERLQYLEVEEDENDRRSFDLNLYHAGMQVKDLQQLLHRARAHYGIRPGQFQALYDQIKTKALGHLAGGIHRNGRDFLNVYYGVAGFPKFSTPFG